MKLTIEREKLLAAATRAASFVAKKNTIPMLSRALIVTNDHGISISATDLEKQITEQVEADVTEHGSVVVPILQVAEIAKRLPSGVSITLTAQEEKVTIRAGRYHTTMETLPVDDFPAFQSFDASCSFTLPANILRGCFQKIAFAISTEETRYYLNGIYVHTDGDKLKFVATDGHRLALTRVIKPEITGEMEKGVIIPRGVISDICRLLDGEADIRVTMNDSRVSFSIGSAIVESKLIEGTFPEYSRVIPKGNDIKAVLPKTLSATIDRVAAVSSERSRPVKFDFTGDELTITCSDSFSGVATDVIEDIDTKPIDIGFQARYVQDMLSSMVGESEWYLADSSAPAVVKDTVNSDILCVIMPMRV